MLGERLRTTEQSVLNKQSSFLLSEQLKEIEGARHFPPMHPKRNVKEVDRYRDKYYKAAQPLLWSARPPKVQMCARAHLSAAHWEVSVPHRGLYALPRENNVTLL